MVVEMSSNNFIGSTDSTCSDLSSTISSTELKSEYKEYHFEPESNPDIKTKIASFWNHLEEANISVPESNFSKFEVTSKEDLEDFKVKKKNEQTAKGKSLDNKWCQLLQLMSRRGLDKLAMTGTPKSCRFCKMESFSPTFADENCYGMVFDVSESKKPDSVAMDKVEEIREMTVDNEEEVEHAVLTSTYDDEIRKLIPNYDEMKGFMQDDEEKEGCYHKKQYKTIVDSDNLQENPNANEKEIEEVSNVDQEVFNENSNTGEEIEYIIEDKMEAGTEMKDIEVGSERMIIGLFERNKCRKRKLKKK